MWDLGQHQRSTVPELATEVSYTYPVCNLRSIDNPITSNEHNIRNDHDQSSSALRALDHYALCGTNKSPHEQAQVIHPYQGAVPDTLILPPLSTAMKAFIQTQVEVDVKVHRRGVDISEMDLDAK